jgi:hypothetical protein
MLGKRGSKPPLPSNCKRDVLPVARRHCSQRSGKAQPDVVPASQETGSAKPMSALSRAKEDTCTLLSGTHFDLPH